MRIPFIPTDESRGILEMIGNKLGIANSLGNLGNVANNQGDYVAAHALQEESLAILRELGDRNSIAFSLYYLGVVAFSEGDYGAARTLQEESLTIRCELGDKLGIADGLDAFAELARQEQQTQLAARLWGAGAALREVIGAPRPPIDQEKFDRETAKARSALGEPAFTIAWEEGRTMIWEQAVEYALGETD